MSVRVDPALRRHADSQRSALDPTADRVRIRLGPRVIGHVGQQSRNGEIAKSRSREVVQSEKERRRHAGERVAAMNESERCVEELQRGKKQEAQVPAAPPTLRSACRFYLSRSGVPCVPKRLSQELRHGRKCRRIAMAVCRVPRPSNRGFARMSRCQTEHPAHSVSRAPARHARAARSRTTSALAEAANANSVTPRQPHCANTTLPSAAPADMPTNIVVNISALSRLRAPGSMP